MFLGDVIDSHAISFHDPEPNCPGPMDEYELAKEKVQQWYKAFPKAFVCIGNHDERPQRLAKKVKIPDSFLKDYCTLWETPGWTWAYDFVIDYVYYTHGTGTGGVHPAWNLCSKRLMSVCIGHNHARSGVKWRGNEDRRIFAMDVGCLIDRHAWQFAYGRAMTEKPVLAAAVVIDGNPIHKIMPMGHGEKYHASRAKRKKTARRKKT
jgi:hypothetical protein